MQFLRLLLVLAPAWASDVTPVQKVLGLMEGMKAKGKEEMVAEQEQYAKFEQFCELTLVEKERSIGDASDKIGSLEAETAQAGSEAERLGAEASQHGEDAATAAEEKKAATEVRQKERTDFQTTLEDYTESIDAIGRATKALKAQDKVSLLQLDAARQLKLMPSEVADKIEAYMAASQESLLAESAAPKPATYEFQSGGVISMLEGLQDKFLDERNTLEQEEQAKKHAYELLAQRLDTQKAQSEKEQSSKEQFKAKKLQAKASGEAELAETKAEKESDVKYSTDLKATCAKKKSAFAERQKLRGEELEAIGKAMEIISGGAVAGGAEKHLPSLLQSSSALAFLRSESPRGQEQVARFLQQKGESLKSRVLAALAVRVSADPLAKVKTMIESLIVKLNEQAKSEATKNAWCETELSSNKQTREAKTDAADSLQAEIDQLKASVAKLTDETGTLGKELTELAAAMAQATDLRTKEKAKNAATIKDAKEAQAAVAQALTVLKDFYAKAADATALVQTKVHAGAPEVFGDEAYTGMGGESGGVLGMIEVIESDFARLEAETVAAEAAAKKEYEEFMEDSKMDKASKEAAVEQKTSKTSSQKQELTAASGDLEGTQKELAAAEAYYEKLRPDCVDTGVAYAERKAQREQEMKDLKEAMEMLSNL
ncbi:unnamed protein product [Effrenium voratum]|uniref:Uncharacterized protein n=1 Tax=Effrenium voratum TaxID=2562239 RepID=A0AA36JGC2_9DINO|nr:unnamed protein product [Effrenium voratum]